MKKYVFFVIILSLCVIFTSCGTPEPQTTEESETEASETEYRDTSSFVLEYDENNNVISQGGQEFHSDHFLTLPTYESYSEFANKANLPEHFITYEQLDMIGKYDVFIHFPPFPFKYENYYYGFVNGDVKITLDIYHNGAERLKAFSSERIILSDEEIELSDIRRVKQAEQSYYYYKGIYLVYSVGGKLCVVKWVSDDVYYSLMVDNFFYPSDDTGDYDVLNHFMTLDSVFEFVNDIAPPDVEQ